MAVVTVSVSVGWKMCKKQQKWKWLDGSAGEPGHQRESQNHSSPSCRESALTQQNLNNKRVKKICMCACSFWIPAHEMTSQSVWPPSVSSDGCHSCFSFICWEWKSVIWLGWAASHTVLQKQMYDFSFVCEWGRGYVSDWENIQQLMWPLPAGCPALC